jgi:hypothetical protein
MAGIALAAPFPTLRWSGLIRLTTMAIRTLAAPVAALLAMILLARSGMIERPAPIARAVLLLIGTGLALPAGQRIFASIARPTTHAASLTTSLALGFLGVAAIRAGHDLRGSRA